LWYTSNGKQAAILTGPPGQGVYDMAFSSNGKTMAIENANGNIYLWSTNWLYY
jgi:hypothetical protein